MNKPYFLFLGVGINQYPVDAHRLNGCVNDLHAVHDFFESKTNSLSHQFESCLLVDEQATKTSVVDHFLSFLGRAKNTPLADQKKHILVFYFSGHGSSLPVTKQFAHTDLDGKMQSVVCYDSRLPNQLPNDLTDKEIAYLTSQVVAENVHLLCVFDCCHAGSGTCMHIKIPGIITQSRMAAHSAQPILIEHMILPKDLFDFNASKIDVPVGAHILLAASNSNQSSKETTINGQQRGIFSYSLLEVLSQIQYSITYQELIFKVNQKVRNRVDNQYPELNSIGIDAHTPFLLNAFVNHVSTMQSGQRLRVFTLAFDMQNGWLLNVGALDGLLQPENPLEVQIFQQEMSLLANGSPNTAHFVCKGKLVEVAPQKSFIEIDPFDAHKLDQSKFYKALVVGIHQRQLKFGLYGNPQALDYFKWRYKVRLVNHQANANVWIKKNNNIYQLTIDNELFSCNYEQLFDVIYQRLSSSQKIDVFVDNDPLLESHWALSFDSIDLVSLDQAEYVVICKDQYNWTIALVADFIPLTAFTNQDFELSFLQIFYQLNHIHKWDQFSKMHNSFTQINGAIQTNIFLKDDIHKTAQPQALPLQNAGLYCIDAVFNQEKNSLAQQSFSFSVKNISNANLFVAVYEISSDFGYQVIPFVLASAPKANAQKMPASTNINMVELKPNQEAALLEGRFIPANTPVHLAEQAVFSLQMQLKVFVSRLPFDPTVYKLGKLKVDQTYAEAKQTTRQLSPVFFDYSDDWTVVDVGIAARKTSPPTSISEGFDQFGVKIQAAKGFAYLSEAKWAAEVLNAQLYPTFIEKITLWEEIKFTQGRLYDKGLGVVELFDLPAQGALSISFQPPNPDDYQAYILYLFDPVQKAPMHLATNQTPRFQISIETLSVSKPTLSNCKPTVKLILVGVLQ